jgi:hypothetical protein
MANYKYNDDRFRPLTHADLAALSWAVRRAAQNSSLTIQASEVTGITHADCVKFWKDYQAKAKAARRAMRKVRELKRQGL